MGAAATLPRDRETTDEEIHEIAKRVQPRPEPDPSDEWRQIDAHRVIIEAWLAQSRPLKLLGFSRHPCRCSQRVQ